MGQEQTCYLVVAFLHHYLLCVYLIYTADRFVPSYCFPLHLTLLHNLFFPLRYLYKRLRLTPPPSCYLSLTITRQWHTSAFTSPKYRISNKHRIIASKRTIFTSNLLGGVKRITDISINFETKIKVQAATYHLDEWYFSPLHPQFYHTSPLLYTALPFGLHFAIVYFKPQLPFYSCESLNCLLVYLLLARYHVSHRFCIPPFEERDLNAVDLHPPILPVLSCLHLYVDSSAFESPHHISFIGLLDFLFGGGIHTGTYPLPMDEGISISPQFWLKKSHSSQEMPIQCYTETSHPFKIYKFILLTTFISDWECSRRIRKLHLEI